LKLFDEIKSLVESIEDDVNRYYEKGNKSAGIRVRKAMQSIKEKAQTLRMEITERKNKRL